jgi:hypothetical protein
MKNIIQIFLKKRKRVASHRSHKTLRSVYATTWIQKDVSIHFDYPTRGVFCSPYSNTILLLLSDKRVLGWGDNHKGQLGDGETVVKEQVEVANTTSFLACGKEHILLIDQQGTLQCKGALFGMEMLDSKPKTKLVFCGEYCCAVLTEDGIVNFYGHGPIPPFHSSCLIGVVEIAFGQEYFLALMYNGSVLYYDSTSRCYESLLKDNQKATRIVSGKSMAFAITKTFQLLQLCDKGVRLNSPSVVPVPPVKDVSCGSKHVLVLTQDKMVYAWGKNKQGQLGLKDRIDREHPTLIASFSLISRLPCSIMAGKNHSIVQVDGDGLEYCYVFGNVKSRDPSDPLQNLSFTVF